MKQIQALFAALVVTAIVAAGMLLIGVNAVLNPNTVPVQDAPASIGTNLSAAPALAPDATQAQVNQLQSQLNNVTQQLNQTQAQLQQDETILNELQRRGVIRIGSDGTVQIFGGRSR